MSDVKSASSWRQRLAARPEQPRSFYVRQAIIIALSLIAASAVVYATFERDGWNLWLTGAYVLVVLSMRQMAFRIASAVAFDSRVDAAAAVAGVDESGVFGLLFWGALVTVAVVTPLIAPLLLVWHLIQALRAREAGPSKDDR